MIRLIPRLDIKGPNLVKGIHLEGLRVLGLPGQYARRYYADGADELMIVDAVASLYGRNAALDLVSRVSDDVFIPLIVGGGIRTLDDIRASLRAGADKVMVNTAAVLRPEFIAEAAEMLGSSTIVVAVEAVQVNGSWRVVTNGGRENTSLEPVSWARRCAELGAGEICITSVTHEGTGGGFALSLVKAVRDVVRCPVIAHGGCGTAADVAVVAPLCDAVAVASVLHYRAVREMEIDEAAYDEGSLVGLRHVREHGFRLVKDCTVGDIRAALGRRVAA